MGKKRFYCLVAYRKLNLQSYHTAAAGTMQGLAITQENEWGQAEVIYGEGVAVPTPSPAREYFSRSKINIYWPRQGFRTFLELCTEQ